MTKSEYFRKCDFNNRKLIDKINYCLYILDNPFNTLTDKTDDECTIRCDKDGTPNPYGEYFRTNRELAEANLQFLKEFPEFEEIVTSLRKNKLVNEFELAIKESAIDCDLNMNSNMDQKHKYKCDK